MTRKNIFQQLSETRDFRREIERIDELLTDKNGIRLSQILPSPSDKALYVSIESFVNKFVFIKWKQRGTCIDCKDMRNSLGFEVIFLDDDYELELIKLIDYLEYVANIIYLVDHAVLKEDKCFEKTDIFWATKTNIESLLDWLNYEQKIFKNAEKVIIIEKNASATAVAEIVSDELAYKVIQYNHYTLKGDIESKKSILLTLGTRLEPHRKELKLINGKLEDSIFYMLNNLDLRHNNRNKEDKNYKEVVAKMNKEKLEEYYDELYQMILLATLELDQQKRNQRVQDLKNQIELVS